MWRLLKKLEIELPYDPAIPLLGIDTEETRIERDTCTPVYIAALFTVARTWKQPRCLLADEWIRKLWHIHTMDCYSAIKRNAWGRVSLNEWMKQASNTEWSKSEKHQYNIFMHIYGIYKDEKFIMMILYARQQKRPRCKEQTSGLWGRRHNHYMWDDLRE